MPCRSGLPAPSTRCAKRRGWNHMRKQSSSTVRVVWPKFTRSELIGTLRAQVRELAAYLPVRRAILFGSWAAGRATAYSDIDILIVYEGPSRDNAFRLAAQSLTLRGAELHVYAESEARELHGLLDRMARGGVDLLVDQGP